MRRIAIVGTGKLARALARSYTRSIVAIAGRDRGRTRAVAALCGAASIPLDELASHPHDILWIATADSAIADVVAHAATIALDWSSRTVVHSSGSMSVDVLQPLAACGATALALHPNVSLRGDEPIPPRTLWGATPEDAASLSSARALLAELDARVVAVPGDRRALYHAAASTASNFSVTLFAAAELLYRRVGFDDAVARELVAAFMQTSIVRAERDGTESTITGPIVRGDHAVVDAQRDAVAASAAELARLFEELARVTERLFVPTDGRARDEGDV